VEHRQIEGRPAASGRASGDDPVRFLRELRQLRDGAGLGQAELAARAHYPYDRIMAAEVGPTLPDLPVLSAYVRGCGGTTEEWEERWRSLTSAPTLPLLDARPSGGSTAASAGARIGAISPAADTPDPAVILAALDRVGEEMAVGAPAALPSRAAVSTIEQRPAAAAPAAAAKSTTAKAGSAKVTAWETTTMRTAWSSTSGPTTQETRQTGAHGSATSGTMTSGGTAAPVGATTSGGAAISGGAATSAGATTSAGAPTTSGTLGTEGSRTVPAQSRTPAYPGTDAARTGSTAPTGPAGAAGAASGGLTSAAGAAGSGSTAGSSTTPATKAAAGSRSRASGGLSRTTIVALIAIAICVLVAALAIFA